MVRTLFRLVGLVCLAGAFAAAVIDAAQSVANERLVLTPMSWTLYWAFPTQFDKLKPFIVNQIHPLLWDPFLIHILLTPSTLVLAILGLFFFYFARRRPPLIGHSNR